MEVLVPSGLSSKEKEAFAIIDRAVLRYNPRAVFALFSGGHDSATATHLLSRHPRFTGVCHIDTGIGIPETQQYVREVCEQFGWKLLIYKALENTFADGTPDPQDYREIVLAGGFPSAPMHTMIYSRLKERQIDRLVRDHQGEQHRPVLLGTGIRRSESSRRKFNISRYSEVDLRGSQLWANPIANFEARDCSEYMHQYGIPRNPVKELLCMSGECLCGCFGSPEELEIIEACYPATGAYLRSLEQEVKSHGFPWGWGEEPPAWWKPQKQQNSGKAFSTRESVERLEAGTLPLCHTCQIRQQEAQENSQEETIAMETPVLSIPKPSPSILNLEFSYAIACIQGVQGCHKTYTAKVPLSVLATVFQFEDADLPPEQRSQRQLNERRAEEIAAYVLENPRTYVFNSITAVINAEDFSFAPLAELPNVGVLRFGAGSRILVLDGQHRQRGIQIALSQKPELGQEHISVDFHLTTSLERRQTIFHDLNRFASKPNNSLTLLYDSRNAESERTRQVVEAIPVFRVLCEKEATTLKKRSIKLFTLNAIHEANQRLLKGTPDDKQVEIAIQFWTLVCEHNPDWQGVLRREMEPAEVRRERLHCTAIALSAMGMVGKQLLKQKDWKEQIAFLKTVDWSRSNPDWEGKCLFNGQLQKNQRSIQAVADYLDSKLKQFVKASN